MTWQQIVIDTLLTGLQVGLTLVGGFVCMGLLVYVIDCFNPIIKRYIKKKIRKWYRKQRRAEHKNRVKNAKAIEQWCREDYYGDL